MVSCPREFVCGRHTDYHKPGSMKAKHRLSKHLKPLQAKTRTGVPLLRTYQYAVSRPYKAYSIKDRTIWLDMVAVVLWCDLIGYMSNLSGIMRRHRVRKPLTLSLSFKGKFTCPSTPTVSVYLYCYTQNNVSY